MQLSQKGTWLLHFPHVSPNLTFIGLLVRFLSRDVRVPSVNVELLKSGLDRGGSGCPTDGRRGCQPR